MPTRDQRQTLSDMWKSLEDIDRMLVEFTPMRNAIGMQIVNMRRPGNHELSEASIATLRQKASTFFDKADDIASEAQAVLDLIDELK